jgi:hypothetical protein
MVVAIFFKNSGQFTACHQEEAVGKFVIIA